MTTNVFALPKSSHPPPKIFAHTDTFPITHLDPQNPPTAKPPWKALHDIKLIKSVSITLPRRLHDDLEIAPKLGLAHHESLETAEQSTSPFAQARYCKLITSLYAILGSTDLRRGPYIFLSEGNPRSNDTVITLLQGKLTLSMDRQVFERSGLPFNAWKVPGAAGGRKHDASSARWRVELDLREPSMVRGRKGFDRLVWAAERVEGLKEPRTWLFCRTDVAPAAAKQEWVPEELRRFHPTIVEEPVHVATLEDVMIPPFLSESDGMPLPVILSGPVAECAVRTDEDIYEIVEYFDMIEIGSPRIQSGEGSLDDIDPYLCMYRLPSVGTSDSTGQRKFGTAEITTLKWRGMISADWVVQLLMQILKLARQQLSNEDRADGWLVLSLRGHKTEAVGGVDGVAILLQTARTTGNEGMNLTHTGQQQEDMDLDTEERLPTSTENSQNTHDRLLMGGFKYFSCFQFVDS